MKINPIFSGKKLEKIERIRRLYTVYTHKHKPTKTNKTSFTHTDSIYTYTLQLSILTDPSTLTRVRIRKIIFTG